MFWTVVSAAILETSSPLLFVRADHNEMIHLICQACHSRYQNCFKDFFLLWTLRRIDWISLGASLISRTIPFHWNQSNHHPHHLQPSIAASVWNKKQGQRNYCRTPGVNLKNKLEETGKTRWKAKKQKTWKKKAPKTGNNIIILKETGRYRKKQE